MRLVNSVQVAFPLVNPNTQSPGKEINKLKMFGVPLQLNRFSAFSSINTWQFFSICQSHHFKILFVNDDKSESSIAFNFFHALCVERRFISLLRFIERKSISVLIMAKQIPSYILQATRPHK